MKSPAIIIIAFSLLTIVFLVIDRQYVSQFEIEFKKMEKQRIVTTNKLATAKIVQENLNHVNELVFQNMVFTNSHDSVDHRTRFFTFLTESIEDLKMRLVSVQPQPPVTSGRITTYAYKLNIEGDFFKFGELCTKLENSRRIISVKTFQMALAENAWRSSNGNRSVKIAMEIETFRINK